MGTKYSSVLITGYNASPPADDGSTAASNQVTWAKHKTKLGDPLNTAVTAINSALVTALDYSSRSITSNDSTVAGDNGKTIVIASTVTTAVTLSLMDAATAAAGYIVRVVNESAVACTVSRATATNTISGTTSDYSLPALSAVSFVVSPSLTGYSVTGNNGATLGANTFTGDQTITSTDASASGGPTLDLYRNSASPAANDVLGYIPFNGQDSGGAKQVYAAMFGQILDPTAASEDGRLAIQTPVAGTIASRVFIGAGLYTAGVTGGDKGVDTINATTYYAGGNQLFATVTNSLGADVALNNTANYFDGPSIAQGSNGTWFASGTVCVWDTTVAAAIHVKLWDGTTVIASAYVICPGASFVIAVSLSGYITSPAGNIRISVRDASSTSGAIRFNASGNSKDSTVSAFRIG